ncbi:hypothetical protein [Pseudomonas aeruginosa]|uniref:hypothetical protein n=1 Tax=Pseudomonas aeruginosa TaxID=287 RepID=UPI0024B5A935|nr:hypothetical protein [Pseudomonas aeruginosa]MDI9296357.1 hypothetical protein [Pseudomonas aeruginosa]MDY1583307.1 hypothetical protein [Pseudomonas aeruginosa]HCE5819545.1 hypothetical protein [Pseudomonas aeruginosa]
MTVKPISDEELDVAERLSVSREVSATATWILNGTVSAIIARLRAAEADAKRYRWLRGFERGGITVRDLKSHLHVEGLDAAIDEAMERTP